MMSYSEKVLHFLKRTTTSMSHLHKAAIYIKVKMFKSYSELMIRMILQTVLQNSPKCTYS